MNLTTALEVVRRYDNFDNFIGTIRAANPKAAIVMTDTESPEQHAVRRAVAWGVVRREGTKLARKAGCTCEPVFELGNGGPHHLIVRHDKNCPAERAGRRYSVTKN